MKQNLSTGRKILFYGLVLMFVCGVSGTSVGVLYKYTKNEIRQKQVQAFVSALRSVFPPEVEKIRAYDARKNTERTFDELMKRLSATGEDKLSFEDMKSMVYIGYDAAGKRVAYTAMGKAQGYQSEIQLLVAVKPDAQNPATVPADPQIINMRVASSQETPGLGENIKKVEMSDTLWSALFSKASKKSGEVVVPKFQAQFSGRDLSQLKIVKVPDPTAILAVTGATISSRAAMDASKKAIETIQKAMKSSGQ